jgi:hypothetical protein
MFSDPESFTSEQYSGIRRDGGHVDRVDKDTKSLDLF